MTNPKDKALKSRSKKAPRFFGPKDYSIISKGRERDNEVVRKNYSKIQAENKAAHMKNKKGDHTHCTVCNS